MLRPGKLGRSSVAPLHSMGWTLGGFGFLGSFAGLADATDYGLDEAIGALFSVAADGMELEFGLAFGVFADEDGQRATQIVFDECGFVAGFLGVPSVGAERGEVARLAFGAFCSGDEILRFLAGGVGDAVELEPRDGADVCRVDTFADGIRQIELDESRDDPSRDRNVLIARLCRGVVFGGACRGFSRRTRRDGTDEIPVFLFGWSVGTGVFFVGGLHPVGDRAAYDIHRHAAAELIEARFGASGSDAKVGLHFGAAVGLRRDGLRLLKQFGAARPERWLKQNAAVDPADFTAGGADFYVVVAAREDFDVVAVVERVHRFADLGDAAPKRDAALADVAVAERFVLGAKEPSDDGDDDEERDGDEELALHAALPGWRDW
jgi:hypothetical protein